MPIDYDHWKTTRPPEPRLDLDAIVDASCLVCRAQTILTRAGCLPDDLREEMCKLVSKIEELGEE